VKKWGRLLRKKFGKGDGKEAKKSEDKNASSKLEDTEVGKVVHFNDGEEEHELWIAVNGDNVEVMVASDRGKAISIRIEEWKVKLEKFDKDTEKEKVAEAKGLLDSAEKLNQGTLTNAKITNEKLKGLKTDKSEAKIEAAKAEDAKVEQKEEALKIIVAKLFKLFKKGLEPDEETLRLVKVLESMADVKGAKGFAGTLKGSKIYHFREGLKRQGQRDEHYYSPEKLLIAIEHSIDGTRVDLVIGNKEGIEAHDTENQIYVEVKRWKWKGLNSDEKKIRLASLRDQLEKYKKANSKTLLEWTGLIPEEVKEICKELKVNVESV
jgi:hypothetical protein